MEVRAAIDRLDQQIVALIAERGRWVGEAAKVKRSEAEVPAPDRVEQVIRKVCSLASEHGLDITVAETTYRAMISAFIELERRAVRISSGS